MTTSIEQFEKWLAGKEDEHLEFKRAENTFSFDDLIKYCFALANEGGGKLILGVKDERPRQVAGTLAFREPDTIKTNLFDRLRFAVGIEEFSHQLKRVLVFHIPSRSIGVPLADRGTFWMRRGESLVGMDSEQIRSIHAETGPDYSAEICGNAVFSDLDPDGIERFRSVWIRASKNQSLAALPAEQLLADAELVIEGSITYAALVLFGTNRALGRYLADAEVIFEYRSREASIPYQHRENYRQGLFLFLDDLWNNINLRNDVQQFQSGLFAYDIPTFNERVVREAVLNSVCHRDYRRVGSVFIRQYPRKLIVESPGGFPPGITRENILDKQLPRNRRIAEAIEKCDLVERSGQGVNLMFQESIKESKAVPDYSGSDDYGVRLTLNGDIQDPRFLRFIEQIGQETLDTFTTSDFLALNAIHQEQRLTDELKVRLPHLIELGIIERTGRKVMLSRRFYSFLKQKGEYTRRRGLDRDTNKALLVKHISLNNEEGSKLDELRQVLPALSRNQVQLLLQELKKSEQIVNQGRTSAARWHLDKGSQNLRSN